MYFGGDGSPWLRGKYISRDPTAREPLTLRLMAQDTSSAVYLGRPCYHGTSALPECTPNLWTDGRYSSQVIQSMTELLRRYVDEREIKEITFFGYSGGSVLATLLAEHFPEVEALVTVAGNLDIDLWADTRGFLPLISSINPATSSTLDSDLIQIHLIGEADRVVAPSVTESFVGKHGGKVWRYSDYDHSCCWVDAWPDILKEVGLEVLGQ